MPAPVKLPDYEFTFRKPLETMGFVDVDVIAGNINDAIEALDRCPFNDAMEVEGGSTPVHRLRVDFGNQRFRASELHQVYGPVDPPPACEQRYYTPEEWTQVEERKTLCVVVQAVAGMVCSCQVYPVAHDAADAVLRNVPRKLTRRESVSFMGWEEFESFLTTFSMKYDEGCTWEVSDGRG